MVTKQLKKCWKCELLDEEVVGLMIEVQKQEASWREQPYTIVIHDKQV